VFLDVYGAYEAAKLTRQAIDFADLIALPVRIFETNPALVEQYRKKYRWVLVDEYQDVSRAVAMLLRHLCGPGNPPWVVGDTRQSIYRFRGAAPENVAQFDQDFPGARTFNLDTNYRSCAEIVRVANQLAALMETPTHEEVIPDARWTAGAEIASLGEPAVTVVRATSDLAEREAIAARVAAWRDLGVPACDIAVLARRNIDVRNAVLELGRRGLRATTAGLVTPEGAAGDLAVIVTLPDQPRASLARLAYALGRERFAVQVVNAVIAQALETLGDDGSFATQGYGEGDPLAVAMRRTSDCLYARRYGGDAFAMMCTFLFDGSDYLRRILEQPQDAERSLALGEIVTSLASAAGYRFTHPEAEPQAARLGFAQVFRAALSSASPSLVAPQPTTDAVRVMTCHAAKGLEFPCVIVAGQTLARSLRVYKWLPSSLQPSAQEDSRQADALLFVGATRARRALVVTYATSAGGTVRSRMRDVTSLLSRWHTLHQVAIQDVPPPLALRERVSMGALWGGTADRVLAARYLDKDACVVRTYLEHSLKIHFPTAVRPLYPLFFDALRRAMGRIVRRAHEIGTQVSLDEAEHFFLQSWPQEDVAGHPHQGLYYELALVYIARFAHAYTPLAPTYQQGEFILDDDTTGLWLRLNLLAYYLTADGTPIAIALRPESLAEKSRPQGVLWSALRTAQRVSFMILKQRDPRLQPYVFSAEDGVLYPYVWTRRTQDFETEVDRIARQGQILKHQRFETTVQTWTCYRCPVRLSCPYWLEALGG
jgi:hypothetical protein